MSAVILDMDGVMIDSERQWRLAEGPFFESLLGGSWRDEDHARIVGLGVVDLFQFLGREYGLKASQESFLSRCDALAADIYGSRVTASAGLLEFLSVLEARSLPRAIATSSPRAWVDMVLERFALRPRFHAVVSGDEAPGRTKPAPDLYLLAASRLGVGPADCWAVEDSRVGVAAAKAAGMRCAAFRNGHNEEQDLSAADWEFRSFSDLPERLEL